MKQKSILLCIFLFLLWQGCGPDKNKLVRELNQVIEPLPPEAPPAYSDDFIADLMSWDAYRLVGMGEATHGTRDFVELRQRLFSYLAEHHKCRTLAYEYSYRKSLLVDDYIHFRNNEPDSLFLGDLWIQDNQVMRDFIFWMREFNRGRPEEESLHFIGIDNQVDALRPGLTFTLLGKYVPAYQTDLSKIRSYLSDSGEVEYTGMSEESYLDIKSCYMEMEHQYDSLLERTPGMAAGQGAGIARKLLRSLQDSHEFLYGIYVEGTNARDRQLAENVTRIVEFSDPGSCVALWAHNAHVACNPHYDAEGIPSMGWYLRQEFGQEYLSLATSFSLGSFTAVMLDSLGNDTAPLCCRISADPPSGSSNELFHKASHPAFFLNLHELNSDSRLYAYFNTDRPMIGVGDLYLGNPELHFTDDRVINLLESHDVLFYFIHTRPLLVNERK